VYSHTIPDHLSLWESEVERWIGKTLENNLKMEETWQSDMMLNSSKRLKEQFNANAIAKLPGAFFFPNIVKEDKEKKYFSSYRSLLEKRGQKQGYISGSSGPKVMAFVPAFQKPFPKRLQKLIDVYLKKQILDITPWQVSMNFYQPGDLMVPHKDGAGTYAIITTLGSPLLLDFHYTIATKPVSSTEVFLKKPVTNESDVLRYFEVNEEPTVTVLMEPGSGLVLSGESFVHYAHSIAGREEDVISEKVVNLEFFEKGKYKIGDLIKRKERVSVVMWDHERKK